ncbi:hypothetical protein [Altericista sp. CCNU0014]|uniref:hypothetical protein n=1 Tax=Altericista sp. CCNU0014 TaxID=3082949 RepID=UPI00384D88D8
MTISVERHYDVEADDRAVLFVALSADWTLTLGAGALAAAGTRSTIEHLGIGTRPKPS